MSGKVTVKYLKIDEIKPYENNPRKNKKAIPKVMQSIEQFGFKVPLVIDKDNVIVTGHTRYMAAKKLGLEELPCIFADDLTEEQVRAYRVADNKVAEFAEWDFPALDLELMQINSIDMTAFGFVNIAEGKENKKSENNVNIESMELRAFEHHDYIVFVFDNSMDWLNVVNHFGLHKVNAGYGKIKKIELAGFLTEKDLLKLYGIKILILSRSRCGSVTTVNLVPDYVEILVPESEADAYRAEYVNPVITIPDEYIGLGQVRNWVLDNFDDKTIIMLDDDLMHCYYLALEDTKQIKDKEEVLQILINTAVMSKDIDLCCFGFSQSDIRKFNGTDPFHLCGWVGGVIGVNGRRFRFRDDKFKVDIDFCLKNLLVKRILWIDTRYYFAQHRDDNAGGNSLFRTSEDFEKSTNSLLERWGRFISKYSHKSQISLKLKVKRKADIKYE